MKKIIIGLIITSILGTCGFFGGRYYQEQKRIKELENLPPCGSWHVAGEPCRPSPEASQERPKKTSYDIGDTTFDKPIIYIYPLVEKDVKATLSRPDLLSISYPSYDDGWNVHAMEDGTLISDDGKSYYGLYYEANGMPEFDKSKGFVVAKEDITSFFEEKLDILGLNYKEKNEFIIYGAPKLSKNDYYFISFVEQDILEEYMGLSIEPVPETLIRVAFVVKPCDKNYLHEEQQLVPVSRNGYTVVEGGGTLLK